MINSDLIKCEILITGTGRCGTGYMSKILAASNIPTGHEEIFTLRGYKKRTDLIGDSSWLAVPMLKNIESKIKIGIWRDKDDVVRSLNKIGVFDKINSYGQFAKRHGSKNAEHHWFHWNGLLYPLVDEFIHIKKVRFNVLNPILKNAGIDYDVDLLRKAFDLVPKNYNTR